MLRPIILAICGLLLTQRSAAFSAETLENVINKMEDLKEDIARALGEDIAAE